MGEAKAVSEGCLTACQSSKQHPVHSLLANHAEGSEHPPLRIPRRLALPLSPGGVGCSNHSSRVRLRPHSHLPWVTEGSAGARAGAVPLRLLWGWSLGKRLEGPSASRPPCSRPPGWPLSPASCSSLCPHRARNKRGGFRL